MKRGVFGKKEPRPMISLTKMLCCLVFILIASALMMWDIYKSSFSVATVTERSDVHQVEVRIPEVTPTPIPVALVSVVKPTPSIVEKPAKQEQTALFEVKNAEDYVQQATSSLKATLRSHPLHSLSSSQRGNMSISDYFHYVSQTPSCKQHKLPVFTSMANVYSELYWQLIENFIYTMVKFELVQCTLMICVEGDGDDTRAKRTKGMVGFGDGECMRRCQAADFPCIQFDYLRYHPVAQRPHPLEQIAVLKLLHIPQALKKNVDVMMLDLDVGFLQSPVLLLEGAQRNVDVYVQKDIAYVMNRTLEGWRTWYTTPLPNIGIFYVRGNEKTVQLFDIAWNGYKTIEKESVKKNPGKDQNKVALALNIMRSYGLKWRYFPSGLAVLLDMVYKYNTPLYELGGQVAHDILVGKKDDTLLGAAASDGVALRTRKANRQVLTGRTRDVGQVGGEDKGVVAVHTTCYEQKIKVEGLKAVNAFWHPLYYSPLRRTITSPLIFLTQEQLRGEVRTLLYLGKVLDRAVIIPNIYMPRRGEMVQDIGERGGGTGLWPGFRTPFFHQKLLPNTLPGLLESGFYYRLERGDYAPSSLIPPPVPVLFPASLTVPDLESQLGGLQHVPRLVISMLRPGVEGSKDMEDRLIRWARGGSLMTDGPGVGVGSEYEDMVGRYQPLPPLKYELRDAAANREVARDIVRNTRLCANLFIFDRGNRSCFNKCD